jgi:diguanylate cyclase (GGDEF)-like protein
MTSDMQSKRAAVLALICGVPLIAGALILFVPDDMAVHLLLLLFPCAAIAWGAAAHRLAQIDEGVEGAIAQLNAAEAGDLEARMAPATRRVTPELGQAIERLFARLRHDLSRSEQRAACDPVTGLASRAHFRMSAERLIDQAPAEMSAALFFVDLDRFKAINDSRGHACGDKVLAKVAERLRVVAAIGAGKDALIGRLAGDEFTLLCPHLDDPARVQAIGESIVATLGAPFAIDGASISVGASVGIALRPQHGTTLQELMAAADAAMYQSKASGRARVSRYDAQLAAELTDREKLDQDLRTAVRRQEFALVFQPQVSLCDGRLLVSEALLRWRHPTLGVRPAAEFLSRAELTGQMVAIGEWVLTAAANTAARWHREGHIGRLALNIGQQQIEDVAFFDRLGKVFARSGAPLDRLELELPEGVAMRCPAPALARLEELREAGVCITIDDFGAGDSNVQRLRALPVDRIKLDPVLIHEIARDSGARTILQALVGLVHGLGCEAVAEGVESDAQVDVLRVIGCDAVQGYAIARPMDDAMLQEWLGMFSARARAG